MSNQEPAREYPPCCRHSIAIQDDPIVEGKTLSCGCGNRFEFNGGTWRMVSPFAPRPSLRQPAPEAVPDDSDDHALSCERWVPYDENHKRYYPERDCTCKAVPARCPSCGHMPHKPGDCLNMASDSDCRCGEPNISLAEPQLEKQRIHAFTLVTQTIAPDGTGFMLVEDAEGQYIFTWRNDDADDQAVFSECMVGSITANLVTRFGQAIAADADLAGDAERVAELEAALNDAIEEWIEPHEYEKEIGIGCAKADPAFPCDQCLLGDRIRELLEKKL